MSTFEQEEVERFDSEDEEAWKKSWETNNQPWRTMPEISKERQDTLTKRLEIKPDLKQDDNPFTGIKLSRADIEWLLATHDNNHGPVKWYDESQRERKGLDLRRADLQGENLQGLPLAKCYLYNAHLEGAYLRDAHLEGAYLRGAHLEKAVLTYAHLEGAYLQAAFFDSATNLENIVVNSNEDDAAFLCDIHWGDVNVAVVGWSKISVLGEENTAKKKYDSDYYEKAARAYRQLSVALRNQGLNEDAARFAFRAQRMQRKAFLFHGRLGQYLFSGFLNILTGYGYRFWRSFVAYAFVIGVFAAIYYHISPPLTWYEPIVISMTAFHGRGFFPTPFNPGDLQAVFAAIEAFVGLFIEITLIATLTQRLFGR